jgi:hypothetical protein
MEEPTDGLSRDRQMLLWPALGCAAAALVVVLTFARSQSRTLPDITGCYTAPGAPDILIDRQHVAVFESPPLLRIYHLEYHKGWAITVEPGFDWIEDPGGRIRLRDGYQHGEFLFVSREFETEPATPSFDLPSASLPRSIRYSRSAPSCHLKLQSAASQPS